MPTGEGVNLSRVYKNLETAEMSNPLCPGDRGDVVDALAGWDRWREMNARIDRAVWKHGYAKGGVLPVDFGGPMPVAAVTGCSYLRPRPVNHELLRRINEGHL